MWCVAELDDKYISKMEGVLETLEKPCDPTQPVVCLDEKPVTLHADVRPPSPAKPGREARQDSEYERRGTANVFCVVEPKAGRHFTFATPDRSGFEFAQVVAELAFQYPDATTIHLIMDNLSSHRRKSLTDLYGEKVGVRNLGPFHRSLHADTWQLAESGRNRNQSFLPAMSWDAKNPRSQEAAPREPRLEPSNESRPNPDQMEV
jgi:DDE superfamily endonuclease